MNDQLLIKYLLNEVDEREAAAVKKWLSEHPDHAAQYQQIQWLWETSGKLNLSSDLDENAAWDRFVLRRDKEAREKSLYRQQQAFPVWMKIAAVITLVFAVGWAVLSFLPHTGKALFSDVRLASASDVKQEVLLDGSRVTLNKHSSVTYSQKLLGNQRLLNMTAGEAYFEVVPNAGKPFVIDAKEVTITVLGTAFNVKKSESGTTVVVDSGVVEVSSEAEQVVLNAYEKAFIDGQTGQIEKSIQDNVLFRYYVTKKFVAEDLPLSELVGALNLAYDSAIEIASPETAELSITTTLEYGSLEKNLEVIQETLGLRVTRNGDKIILE